MDSPPRYGEASPHSHKHEARTLPELAGTSRPEGPGGVCGSGSGSTGGSVAPGPRTTQLQAVQRGSTDSPTESLDGMTRGVSDAAGTGERPTQPPLL